MSVSARYWRIQATGDGWHPTYPKNTSGLRIMGFVSGDASGTDIWEDKTASASSIYAANRPASNAVDGDNGTYWLSELSPADYQWFEVDLATAAAIRSLSVFAGYGTSERTWPRTFDLLASSDGSTWQTVASLESENVEGFETWTNIQAGTSGIARPLIDGMGHSRFIDSRMLIR